jgi:hypothetical protein
MWIVRIIRIIFNIILILCLAVFWWIFLNKDSLLENITIVSTGGNVATGLNVDLSNTWIITINTGDTLDNWLEKTDANFYSEYKENWNFRSFSPAKQSAIGKNYATSTQLMNAYLSNNTFQFSLPKTIKSGYLYIRLKKPTPSAVFSYWYGSNKKWYTVSWDLDKTKSLIDSDAELLYKLDAIPYIRFYDKKSDTYNWLSQMNLWTNNNFIAWFVRDYDWSNKIDELTIAWE